MNFLPKMVETDLKTIKNRSADRWDDRPLLKLVGTN